MNKVYKKACTEVLEALKYIPLDEYHKIPYKTIAFMEENKDKDFSAPSEKPRFFGILYGRM